MTPTLWNVVQSGVAQELSSTCMRLFGLDNSFLIYPSMKSGWIGAPGLSAQNPVKP